MNAKHITVRIIYKNYEITSQPSGFALFRNGECVASCLTSFDGARALMDIYRESLGD